MLWAADHRPHKTKAVFGSVTERLMMPYHPPHSRAGIEQCLRGAPNRGPGCYDPPPVRYGAQQICCGRQWLFLHLGETVSEPARPKTKKQERLVFWRHKRVPFASSKRGWRSRAGRLWRVATEAARRTFFQALQRIDTSLTRDRGSEDTWTWCLRPRCA